MTADTHRLSYELRHIYTAGNISQYAGDRRFPDAIEALNCDNLRDIYTISAHCAKTPLRTHCQSEVSSFACLTNEIDHIFLLDGRLCKATCGSKIAAPCS